MPVLARHEPRQALDESLLPGRLARFLTDREVLVSCQRAHRAFLFLPMIYLFGGLGLVVLVSTELREAALLLWYAWLVLFGWVLFKIWEWSRMWVIVTDRRLIRIQGTVVTRFSQLLIAMGRDITVVQPLLGELLDFGSFRVESAREDHPMRLMRWIDHPEDLQRRIADAAHGTVNGNQGVHPTMVAPVIGGEGDGGIVVVDTASRNPPQRLTPPPAPRTAKPWARPGLWASRPVPTPTPARVGQNRNPGIVATMRPTAHARGRVVQDLSLEGGSGVPAGGPGRRLRLIENLRLFRRRG